MCRGADPAHAQGDHLRVSRLAALENELESSKEHARTLGVFDDAVVDGGFYLEVAFDPGDGINGDFGRHIVPPRYWDRRSLSALILKRSRSGRVIFLAIGCSLSGKPGSTHPMHGAPEPMHQFTPLFHRRIEQSA